MIRKFRTAALLTALVLVCGLLVSCVPEGQRMDALSEFLAEDDSKALDDHLKLAWSPKNLDEEYFVKVTAGFEAYCEENEYYALVANPSVSSEEQYSEFENWVAMDVDAIAAAPIDTARLTDMVSTARQSGIIVSGFYSKIPSADINFTLDQYDLGFQMGQNALRWIDEKLGGKGKVVLVLNDTDGGLKSRGSGIKDALKQHSGVITVYSKSVDSVPDAKSAAVFAFDTYPDIDAVICINDEFAVGVLEVTYDIELEAENFYIGGAGYTEDAVQEMNVKASPFRSTVNLSPEQNGRLLASMMAEAVVNGVGQETMFFTPINYWQNTLGWE